MSPEKKTELLQNPPVCLRDMVGYKDLDATPQALSAALTVLIEDKSQAHSVKLILGHLIGWMDDVNMQISKLQDENKKLTDEVREFRADQQRSQYWMEQFNIRAPPHFKLAHQQSLEWYAQEQERLKTIIIQGLPELETPAGTPLNPNLLINDASTVAMILDFLLPGIRVQPISVTRIGPLIPPGPQAFCKRDIKVVLPSKEYRRVAAERSSRMSAFPIPHIRITNCYTEYQKKYFEQRNIPTDGILAILPDPELHNAEIERIMIASRNIDPTTLHNGF